MVDRTAILRARFDDFEQFQHALRALKESGAERYEAYGPVNLAELEDLMPKHGSAVRWAATIGAVVGLAFFLYLCISTSQVFNLIVGGKPPVSNVPFIIVAYEGTILLGATAAFLGVLALAHLAPWAPPPEYDPRFSSDTFGIFVQTQTADYDEMLDLLEEAGAKEIDEV